jgi:hypothetical protein
MLSPFDSFPLVRGTIVNHTNQCKPLFGDLPLVYVLDLILVNVMVSPAASYEYCTTSYDGYG